MTSRRSNRNKNTPDPEAIEALFSPETIKRLYDERLSTTGAAAGKVTRVCAGVP